MDVAVSSINIASESKWPSEVKAEWDIGITARIPWEALQEEANGWRRITMRVTPQLFAMVQAEAQRRRQSLNHFCVDELQIQVGTRSHQIENAIFHFFYGGGHSGKTRSTSLPTLRLYVSRNIPDCSFQDLEFALKRLNQAKYLKLDKLGRARNPSAYMTEATMNNSFILETFASL